VEGLPTANGEVLAGDAGGGPVTKSVAVSTWVRFVIKLHCQPCLCSGIASHELKAGAFVL
jgi:hypothetical protein